MTGNDRTALIRAFHASTWQGVMSITGGGASSLGWLLSIPGGSRTLLEGIVPYSDAALTSWLRKCPDQACSSATALAMATVAYQRAGELNSGPDQFGLGCTAALVSERPKRGDHRIHVGLQTAERTELLSLTLNKGARGREEEEAVAAELILQAFSHLIGEEFSPLLLNGETVERRQTFADALLRGVVRGEQGVVWREANGRWSAAPAVRPGGMLCGSFNPLHVGHRELREAAEKFLKQPIGYEISVTNVDKPPLDYLTIDQRLEAMAGVTTAVTSRPMFSGKGEVFAGMWFVVGMDTAMRIVDPRYAGRSEDSLVADLEKIRHSECRFLVAGRKLSSGYQTCRDLRIPAGFEDLFVELPESDFREDISSTEIRSGGEKSWKP